jgi:hypothetical protein
MILVEEHKCPLARRYERQAYIYKARLPCFAAQSLINTAYASSAPGIPSFCRRVGTSVGYMI